MKVLVVGAGIGGLAVAAGLQRRGVDVTVLERAERFAQAGSGLSLFGNGLRALDALGIGAAVRQICAAAPFAGESGFRLPSGRWLGRTGMAATKDLRVVDRTDLHQVLLGCLAPGTVRTGSGVQAVREGEVELADGSTVTGADVVIAADGIRSATRAGWPNPPAIRYAGYVGWRAVTREPVAVEAVGETWGRGCRFGISPLADGRVYWFASTNRAPDTSATDPASDLAQRFGSWHRPIPELLDATDPAAIGQLPIEELAQTPATFVRGRTVLLGDAAHAMTPNLGQGANQALEDAATLALLLAPHAVDATPRAADVAAALARYDAIRRPRTARIAIQARWLGAVGQWNNPVASTVRDLAIRLTPDRLIDNRAVQLQDWQPPTG